MSWANPYEGICLTKNYISVKPASFEEELQDEEYTHDAEVAEFSAVVLPSELYKDGEEPECIWYHNGEQVEEGDEKYEIVIDGDRRRLRVGPIFHYCS